MRDEGWISVEDELPKPRKEVQVKTSGNHVFLSFLDFTVHGFDWSYLNNYEYWIEGIEKWRPLPEKRPDFGKLREGDLIVITFDNVKNNYCGFFQKIEGELFYFNFVKSSEIGLARYYMGRIKKITRINMVEQTFEEI